MVVPNCRWTHSASFYQYGMMITWIAGDGIGMKLWSLDEDVKSMAMVETGKFMGMGGDGGIIV